MPKTRSQTETDKETTSDFPRFGTPEEEEADEHLWEEQFAKSGDFLTQLFAEADEARRQGILLPLETIFDD